MNLATRSTSYGTPPLWTKTRLINTVIDFIYNQLPYWRDTSPQLPEAERKLNEHLCVFLEDKARAEGHLFAIHHEQSQSGQRTIDLGANPTTGLLKISSYSSIYQKITVIEAKRLPAPDTRREREYVIGEGGKITGGIQRFKLGEHGAEHQTAAIVGYIQKHDAPFFHSEINGWIEELASNSPGEWDKSEALEQLAENSELRTSRTKSVHCRSEGLADICLHHLWVRMSKN